MTARAALLPTICLSSGASALRFMDAKVPGIGVAARTYRAGASAPDPPRRPASSPSSRRAHALRQPGVARPPPLPLPPRRRGMARARARDLAHPQPVDREDATHAHRPALAVQRPSSSATTSRSASSASASTRPGARCSQQQLRAGDLSQVVRRRRASRSAAGAHVLDVNMGVPLTDEADLLARAVRLVQEHTDLPICIDSSVVEALEAGLAAYEGKALVNSVTGEDDRLDAILPLVKRHGAADHRAGQRRDGHPGDRRRSVSRSRGKIVRRRHGGVRHPDRGHRHRPARDDRSAPTRRGRHDAGDDLAASATSTGST